MTDLLILISLAAVLGAGGLFWRFRPRRGVIPPREAGARRREDARDWQRRFGADSLLAADFLQPTQNEILETLYMLDHLTPGWENGGPGLIERRFLNELALNFPSLRKANCAFPLPFAAASEATKPPHNPRARGAAASSHQPETIAARREEFRVARAQLNALEQIVSASPDPDGVTPAGSPDRPAEARPQRPAGNPWPTRLAGVAVLLAGVLGVVHFLPRGVRLQPGDQRPAPTVAEAAPVPSPEIAPAVAEPSSPPAAVVQPAVAAVPVSRIAPDPPPVPAPPDTRARDRAAFEQQVAASKQRAVGKYPALAVEGSEINLRFVFRYKNLVQQHSPRLLDPTWPEQLVEECAQAAGLAPKRDTLTQVLGPQR